MSLKMLSVASKGRGILIPNPGEETEDVKSVLVAFHVNGRWEILPINVDQLKRQLPPEVLYEYGYTPVQKNPLGVLAGLLGLQVKKPSIEEIIVEFHKTEPLKRDEVEAYFDAAVENKESKELLGALKTVMKYYG